MKRWPTKPLGEFVEEQTERLRQNEATIYSVTNGSGFVRSLDLFQKQVFSADTGNYKRVGFQDLAYNPSRINVGSVAMLEDKNGGAVSPMYVIVRCKSGLLPRYLLHFLKSKDGLNQIRQRCEGAVRFQLKFRDLSLIPIVSPPLVEQERIVKLLDEADALRKLRAQADGRTARLIPALFHQMFGETGDGKSHWPVRTLGELISNGPQNGLYKHSSSYGSGIPILRIDAFYDGEVEDLSALKRLRATPDEIQRYGLHKNDIVINRVNSSEYLGKSALIPDLPEPIVFESNMMRFTVTTENVEPGYLIRFLQTTDAKRHILGRAKHSINQSSINQEDVKCMPVPVPPLAMQKEFAKRVTEIRAMEAEQTASRTRLDALFQSMLHRAFNGDL